jgi:hypothetical protein
MLVGGTGLLSLGLSQPSVTRIPHCFLQGLAGRGSAPVRSEPRGVSSRSYAGGGSARTGAGRVSENTLLLGSSVNRGSLSIDARFLLGTRCCRSGISAYRTCGERARL